MKEAALREGMRSPLWELSQLAKRMQTGLSMGARRFEQGDASQNLQTASSRIFPDYWIAFLSFFFRSSYGWRLDTHSNSGIRGALDLSSTSVTN